MGKLNSARGEAGWVKPVWLHLVFPVFSFGTGQASMPVPLQLSDPPTPPPAFLVSKCRWQMVGLHSLYNWMSLYLIINNSPATHIDVDKTTDIHLYCFCFSGELWLMRPEFLKPLRAEIIHVVCSWQRWKYGGWKEGNRYALPLHTRCWRGGCNESRGFAPRETQTDPTPRRTPTSAPWDQILSYRRTTDRPSSSEASRDQRKMGVSKEEVRSSCKRLQQIGWRSRKVRQIQGLNSEAPCSGAGRGERLLCPSYSGSRRMVQEPV
jgi:hypothetical protein